MASSPHQPFYLDTGILRLVEESDVSVRLSNALHAVSGLPIEYVRDYLDAGPDAKLQFLRVPNLGRKSADELDELIRKFADEARSLPAPKDESPPQKDRALSPSVRERLVALFAQEQFPAIILDNSVSTRLETCLRDEPTRPFSEVLFEWPATCTAFLGRHNVGRRSIVELSTLALDQIHKRLRGCGFTPQEISAAAPIILMGSSPSAETAAMLGGRLDTVVSQPPILEAVPDQLSLAEAFLSSLSALDERERDVLMRRYGYPDRKVETLESIADDYDVTRERIRQIEAKALRKLSLPARKRVIEAAFNSECATIAARLHSGLGYLKEGNLSKAFESLAATDRVALDILFKSRNDLLDRIAHSWHGGWLFESMSAVALDAVHERICSATKEIPLPNTLALLAGNHPPELAKIAIDLGTGLSVVDGYVTDRRVGRRLRRTIGLHRELAAKRAPMDIRGLLAGYHKSYPADPCSVRDAIIVMCLAPHLFIELQDGVWAALGKAPAVDHDPSAAILEMPEQVADSLAEAPSEQTIRTSIREILSRCGPLRFVDLRTEVCEVLGQKHAHSVGPIVLTSGSFVRPLPGVYALPEQLPSLSNIAFDPPAFLLNEEQARWLAMARFAGEPIGSFSLWQPQTEYALCRWAQTQASPAVWQSLLAVASIDQWPVSDREKEHWRSLQGQKGAYALAAALRYPIRQLWPPLQRVFAALLLLRARDGVNWMIGNRLLKRRLDAHASAAVLGILCLLGAVSPPSHWQKHHPKLDNADDLIEGLTAALQETGELKWESEIGASLIARLSGPAAFSSDAWLTPALVSELRSVAGDNPADTLLVPEENEEDTESFDQLLQNIARQQQLALIQEELRDDTVNN